MPFKRKPEERKIEAKKSKEQFKEQYPDIPDYPNIRNRLGLRNDAPKEKIVFELHRLKCKSEATWKALQLSEKDFKKFGVDIPK
ncbi:hypothetical protein LCGC14_2807220 [marine sediment metagenome]|uniref:Uncharacterized protein n=1 Tax=marine sediment metagenome TaxID=412755 RepID=A0A0F8YKZ2_9ZZZZ